MAEFNPQIPDTQDPNYLSYSKPIGDITPDKSKGMQYAAIGDAAEAAVSIGDTVIKKSIDNEIYDTVERERSSWISSLEKGSATDFSAQSRVQPPQEVPGDLQTRLDELSRLKDGRGSVKMNDTGYTARLYAEAKELRNKYGPYRAYIDKRFNEISGMNVANAYYQNMMADLNAQRAAVGDQVKATRGMIMEQIKAGVEDAPKWLADFDSGRKNASQVHVWVNGNQRVFRLKDELTALNGIEELDLKGQERSSQQKFGTIIDNRTNQVFKQSANIAGFGELSGEKLDQFLQSVASGDVTFTSEQYLKLGQFARERKRTLKAEMVAASKVKNAAGFTFEYTLGGADKASKFIDDRLKIWDDIAEAYDNKDFGRAYDSQKMTEAYYRDSERDIMKDKDIGPYLTMSKVIRNSGGDAASQDFFKRMLPHTSKVGKQLENYVQTWNARLLSQSDPNRPGIITTVGEAIDDAMEKKLESPAVYKNYIDIVDGIANPKYNDVTKLRLFDATFSTKNEGVTAKFDHMKKDPKTGQWMNGRQNVFWKWTRPEMAESIKKLEGVRPGIFKQYTDWATNEFRKEMFEPEINNFAQITDAQQYKITWDDKNYKFDWVNMYGPYGRANTGYTKSGYFEDSMTRFNVGIGALANIAKAAGADPNVYVLGMLNDMGISLKGKVAGIPEEILKAVLAPAMQKKLEAEGAKRASGSK